MSAVCPYPHKYLHKSEKAANDERRRLQQTDRDTLGRLVAFDCGDHYHVGHQREKAMA